MKSDGVKTQEELKLNLGCYDKKLPGFTNVDIRENVNPDVVDDAFKLETFKDDSVDLIYASHLLEHVDYKGCRKALMRWYDVLKPGGILRLAVPDFDALCRRYIYTGNLGEIKHSVSGSQKHPFDFHMNIFTKDSLTEELESVGFDDVKIWTWWTTPPHSYCDDFSQAYIPARGRDIALSHGRLDVGDGILVSLNLEGIK